MTGLLKQFKKHISFEKKSLGCDLHLLRKLIVCMSVIVCPHLSNAEVIPADGSRLNYTQVYFEEELKPGTISYELKLFSDSALSHEIKTLSHHLPSFWLSDLAWATKYYWQVSAFDAEHKLINKSPGHRFEIMKIVYQSYDEIRIDVIKNLKEKHSGGLISLDYTRSIIDREGKPVWTIPPVDGIDVKNTHIRDLRITADNTITFLTIRVPYEIDFDGKLLWKAPFPCVFKGDSVVYHHDFKKTKRGTYMVLGERKVNRRLFGTYTEESLKLEPDAIVINGLNYKRILVSVLLEFDKEGKIIWYWDANDYIADEDLNFKKSPTGVSNFATHANAFSENEEGTKVYVGFRDLSRIVKIDKKSKQVEQSYGERYPSGEARIPVSIYNQHDANVTNHNSIYVFNNNGFKNAEGVSTILELKDNVSPKDSVVLWRFNLDFDNLSKGKSVNGGNIVELSPTNLLFCAGALNRVFEITKNKEIVWDVFLYSRGINDTLWQAFVQYRANWIKQLNRCHFFAELPVQTDEKSLALKLTNTGNVEDVYEILVYSGEEELLQSFRSKKILCNETFTIQTKLNKRVLKANKRVKNGGKGCHVVVKSLGSSRVKMLKM